MLFPSFLVAFLGNRETGGDSRSLAARSRVLARWRRVLRDTRTQCCDAPL